MKIILGPKQAEFLRQAIEDRIEIMKAFYEGQRNPGGPSNPKTIRLNESYALRTIKQAEALLEKLK